MNYFFALLRQKKLYWLWRLRFIKFSYFFYRINYRARESVSESGKEYVEVRSLFNAVQVSVFLAVALAAGLWFLDGWMEAFYKIVDIKFPATSDYISLLSGVAGVGGVFIGLYYAAVGGVVSAVYSKAPPAIRSVFSERMYGGAYMRYLSFITVMCLCLIAFTLLTGRVSILSIPIIVLCAAFGVFSFVKLGQQVFNLFDQAYISRRVFEQLSAVGVAVGSRGHSWRLSGFQDYYQRQAASQIDVLKTLLELIRSDPVKSPSSYLSLCGQSCNYLTVYVYQKRRIPVDSKWYPTKSIAQSWANADHFSASIASRSGTSLMPATEPDFEWIEAAVFPIILACLKSLVELGDVAAITRILKNIAALAERLSVAGELPLALTLLEGAGKSIFPDSKKGEEIPLNGELALVAIDALSLMPSIIFVGYINFLNKNDLSDSAGLLSEAEWGSKSALYSSRFPFCYLGSVDWLSKRLDFELRVKGAIVSPAWYRLELLRLSEAIILSVALKAVTLRVTDYFDYLNKQAINSRLVLPRATGLSREWEYWVKLESLGSKLFDRYESIVSNPKLDGLEWPEPDLAKQSLRFIGGRKSLLTRRQIQSAFELERKILSSPIVEHADYSGQFLILAADQIANSFISNSLELSQECFEEYILASCYYFYRNFNPDESNSFFRAARFLKEAMEVSSFGKLLSEFHNNDALILQIKKAWVSINADGLFVNEIAGNIAAYNILWERERFAGGLNFPYRESVRSFERMVQDLPKLPVDYFYSEAKHDSSLIRLFSTKHSGIELIDLFMVTIALPLELINIDSLTFGQKDLLDAMARKQNR